MIAIFSKTFDRNTGTVARRLIKVFRNEIKGRENKKILLYKPLKNYLFTSRLDHWHTFVGYDDIDSNIRLLISLGGDGTFLDSINIVRDRGIPVMGINTGNLGFLSNIAKSISTKFVESLVEKLLTGDLPIEERTLLHATINDKPAVDFPYALNDVVIHKNTSGLITIHTWSNDDLLNSYWADGLIVATPTGSSAYSLSVGGPIVAPESQNFIISPIAAHNLNVRPLVIPDNVTLKLKPESRNKGTFKLSLDSRTVEYTSGTTIQIKRADFKIKIVKTSSFYTTLRKKLMWGVDKRKGTCIPK